MTRHSSPQAAGGVSLAELKRTLKKLREKLAEIDSSVVVPKRTGRSDSLRARKERLRKEIEDVKRAIKNTRQRIARQVRKEAEEKARKEAEEKEKKQPKKKAKPKPKPKPRVAPVVDVEIEVEPEPEFELVAEPEPPKPRRRKRFRGVVQPVAIALPREILELKTLEYHAQLKQRKGGIRSPNRGHAFDATWRVNRKERQGVLRNHRVQQILNESTLESVLRKIERDLSYVQGRMPQGELFVSFSLYEYGSDIVGSPGEKFFTDREGDFYNSHLATRGSSSFAGAAIQARTVLEEVLSKPQNAVLLDSYTVKSYVFKK